MTTRKCLSPPPVDADYTHPLYSRYAAMRNRCNNPSANAANHYHKRGIKVCQEWQESFLAYVKHVESLDKPSEEHKTLDRIDNDGHYEPGNLRWATAQMQSDNSRVYCKHGRYADPKRITADREWDWI